MQVQSILASEIQLKVTATSWQSALKVAAQPLIDEGKITPAYVTGMIASVKKLGPYIVIAPGLALGHARPSAAVKQTSIAIATLAQPVKFGNAANDPVDLVIVLASINASDHLSIMRKIVGFLNDQTNLAWLRAANTSSDALAIAERINGGTVQ